MADRAKQEQGTPAPLPPRCMHCGEIARYDILRGEYHCLFCGDSTPVQAPLDAMADWQREQLPQLQHRLRAWPAALYRCPGCGSAFLMEREDDPRCSFCSEPLQLTETGRAEIPALLLPFQLEEKQAKKQLQSWLRRSPMEPEARRLKGKGSSLRRCYLPCQLVEGPVHYRVSRFNSQREYRCTGSLDAVPVCALRSVDSVQLDAVGPFDFSKARQPDASLLAGQRLALRDVSDEELWDRTRAVLEDHYRTAAERELGMDDIRLEPDAGDSLTVPVLVPVYLARVGETTVLINGQTGQLALNRDKPRRSLSWVLEPLILTLLSALFWFYASRGNGELLVLGTAACAILAFSLLGGGRSEKLRRKLFHIGDVRLERLEQLFHVQRPEGAPAEPEPARPRFFETVEGERVPVKVHYYNTWRVLGMLILAVDVMALPVLISCLVLWLRRLGGAMVSIRQLEPAYGAAWYVLAAAAFLLTWLGLGRGILFDHPLLERESKDGSTQPIPDAEPLPSLRLWRRLRNVAEPGAILGVGLGVAAVLAGSILAMLL